MRTNEITNVNSRIIIGLFVAMLIWWFFIFANSLRDTPINFLYGAVLGILPLAGSIFGFRNAVKWGGFKSDIGKALMLLSLGLLTWGIGTLIFAYYNIILQIAVPYPSLADLFYIISWPLWVVSMINLSRATGANFQLGNRVGHLVLFIIPVLMVALSYYLLITVARGGGIDFSGSIVKIFFDLAYPIGDVIILTVATLIYGLSFKYLGGSFKWPILIILTGFVMNYISDFSFSYTTTKETFFVAGWVDLMFTLTFFLLSLGASLIEPGLLHRTNENYDHA